jgi:molybdopterin molybdotransferase
MPVNEALGRILAEVMPAGAEHVPLMQALGRILARDIYSPMDLPPFDVSSMDGYAVRADDIAEGVRLRVIADVSAGQVLNGSMEAGEVVRIMTGAAIPKGADAVVPVEQTDAVWAGVAGATGPDEVTFRRATKRGDNIRLRGENVMRGQLVLSAGTRLRPQDLGMAASLGMMDVEVSRQPQVVIVSSGDELVTPGEPLPYGSIYESNGVMLAGLVEQWGGRATVLPTAKDEHGAVRAMLQTALALRPDVIVSSAGVSVGAADYIKAVLAELGEVGFWKVNIRPGKPLAYGRVGGVPFFGLPGNPVSAMVTAMVILRPALLQMTGQIDDVQRITAVTGDDIPSDGRQSYVRVTLSREGGQIIARLTGTQSSGALLSMVIADGLLVVPEGVMRLNAGSEAEVLLLRLG